MGQSWVTSTVQTANRIVRTIPEAMYALSVYPLVRLTRLLTSVHDKI